MYEKEGKSIDTKCKPVIPMCNSKPTKVNLLSIPPSHLCRQGSAIATGNVATAVADAERHGVIGVIILGIPVILGLVTDAGGLGSTNGHIIVVAIRVHDGGHIKTGAARGEVHLAPSSREGARGGRGGGGLAEAELGVLLEGDDLVLAG